MKKFILLSAIVFSGLYLNAQGLQLGVKLGINTAGNLTTKIPNIVEGPVKSGFVAGVFGRASLLGIFVQPEIQVSQRVGEFQQVSTGSSYTNTITTLDFNAMVGLSLVGVLRVMAGPTMMTFLSTSQDASGVLKDAMYSKDFYNSTAFGFQMGAGIDLGQLCVDLRYDHSLTSLGKESVYASPFGHGTNYNTGFGMWQFTIGYKIIKI